MAVGAFAGIFTKRGTTGVQQVATPGLRPVAVIVAGFGATSISTSRPSIRGSAAFLFATPGGGFQSLGRTAAIRDGALAGDTAGGPANGLVVPSAAAATTGQPAAAAALTRVWDGGFDLTWTVNDGGTETFAFLAIGGDVQAWGARLTLPQSTGPFLLSGAPFAPRLALLLPWQPGGANLGIGAAAAASVAAQWGLSTLSAEGADPTRAHTRLVSGSVLCCVDGVGKVVAQAQVSGFTANGLALRATTAAPAAGYGAQVLLLGGSDLVALTGTLAKPTAPGAVTLSAVTWRPLGLLTAGGRGIAANATADGVAVGIGVAADDGVSPPGAGAVAAADRDGSSSAIAAALAAPAAFVRPGPASGSPGSTTATVRATAVFSDYGGSLRFDSTDAVAERTAFLVVGGARRAERFAGGALASAALSTARAQLGQFPLLSTVTRPALASAVFSTSPALLSLAPVFVGDTTAAFGASGAVGFAVSFEGDTVTRSATSTPLLGSDQPLVPVSALRIDALATGRLLVPWPLVGGASASFGTSGFLRLSLPDLLPAGPFDIPGTINYVLDPGYEYVSGSTRGLGWTATGAILAADTSSPWWGDASARATFTAPDQQIVVATIAGINTTDARVWTGSIRAKLVSGVDTVRVCVVARYSDGSSTVGPERTLALSGAWRVLATDPVRSEFGRHLFRLELQVRSTGAAVVLLDGAQLEEGTEATGFCAGALGAPSGSWLGPANQSPSWRQTRAMHLASSGRGGIVQVNARLYRSTFDNRWQEDLSDWVIDGAVDADPGRALTWSLDCTLAGEGWARLRPYLDWVAPWLSISYPDGSVSEGQLGLYLVLDSPAARRESGFTVDLRAVDPLWLLDAQEFALPVRARAGTKKTDLVRRILRNAVLTGGSEGDRTDPEELGQAPNPPRRLSIPDLDRVFRKDAEWPRDTSRLELVNEVLQGAGCTPLFSTAEGVLAARRLGREGADGVHDRLGDRTPVRTYVANLPPGRELAGGARPFSRGMTGDVVGVIDTTPKADRLEDEVALVNDRPEGGRIQRRFQVRDRDNPRAVWTDNGRRRRRRIHGRLVEEDATAHEVAQALVEQLSLRTTTATVRVLPEPDLELLYETVGLAVWDRNGDPAANGQWAVQRVRWGFTPSDAVMELGLGRVDGLEGIVR
jgi:hypothetical protein